MKSIYKYLAEKVNQKGVPLKPFEIVQWAQNEPSRPLTAANLLEVAKSIKETVDGLDAYVIYVPTSVLVMDQIFSQEIANASIKGLDNYKTEVLRFGTQIMVGLAVNAIHWDYSPIRFYNQADPTEVQDGYTADFRAKHISGTEDAKSARKVAKERMKDVDDKVIPALGKIVTARSAAIVKDDVGTFAKEIRSRQIEFTNTHRRLTKSFGERWQTLGKSDTFQYLDGITFRTKQTYRMFEFEDGKGSEGSYFIDFSLSADQTGNSWAVHHLAGARTQNVIPLKSVSVEDTLGQQRGETPVDPMTYMNGNPFQGGRRLAGSES